MEEAGNQKEGKMGKDGEGIEINERDLNDLEKIGRDFLKGEEGGVIDRMKKIFKVLGAVRFLSIAHTAIGILGSITAVDLDKRIFLHPEKIIASLGSDGYLAAKIFAVGFTLSGGVFLTKGIMEAVEDINKKINQLRK